MPLWGEDGWGEGQGNEDAGTRWGLVGGEFPGAGDWFQIAEDTSEDDILSLASFSSDLYAGSSSGGIIFSSSDGTTWSTAYDSPESRINELHEFSSQIYAATGGSGLVYRSSDGSSWTLAYDGPDTDIFALETFSSNLYHGGEDGIIRRSSNGTTWTVGYDGGMRVHDLEVFDGDLYAAVSDLNTFPEGDNLIAFWDMDESSGTRQDSIGVNDLADNNTVTTATAKVGANAAQFDSSNSEYLSIADNTALSMGDIDFTIACWVYLDDKSGFTTFVGKMTNNTNNREYLVDYDTGNDRFRFLVSNDGIASATVLANNLGSPSTATWYFIVAWHDSVNNTINIQVDNGTVDSTAHTTGVFDGASDFRIGALVNSLGTLTNFMDGRIDAVGIWKAVLTSGERTTLYNSGSGTRPSGRIITSSNGTTWTLAYDAASKQIKRLAAHGGDFPDGSATLAAGMDGRFTVLKSTDGTTWSLSYEGLTTIGGVKSMHATNAMLYAGSEAGGVLYRSDNLVDWSISYDSPETGLHAMANFNDPPNLYIGSGSTGLIYSMDNYVEIDNSVDLISPDGGETITTDTFTVEFSAPSPYDSAVAHWKLEEVSGTRSDSANSHDLTDNNTVTSAPFLGTARVGTNYAQFTAANSEYLNASSTSLITFGDEDMSVSAWARLDSKSDYRIILSKWDAPNNEREYMLDYDQANDRFRFLVSTDGTGGGNVTTVLANNLGSPNTTTWYFIVAWHDSVNNQIGIQVQDGTADTSAHTGGIFAGSEDIELGRGRFGGGVKYYDGRLDSVTVYNKVLTAAEKTALFNVSSGTGQGLEYPLPAPSVVFDMEYTRNHSTNRDWSTAVDDQGVTNTGENLTSFTAWFPKFENIRAHWTLDEASGNRSSLIGSHTLTDNNTVTGAAGKVGQACQFTRANSEYFNTASTSNISFGDEYMILTCWVYLDSKPNDMAICGKWNADGVNNREFLLWYRSTGDRFRFTVSSDGSAQTHVDANNLGSPSTATWYFIQCQHNPSSNNIQISVNNGTANSTSHSGGINQGSTDFEIGRARFADADPNHFNGRIDEVTLFGGGMGDHFRSTIYNSGNGRAMMRAFANGQQLETTWKVLPIVDSSDMKLRVRARDTTASNGSWDESDDVFTLQNGPC